jgi:hypothetical protein
MKLNKFLLIMIILTTVIGVFYFFSKEPINNELHDSQSAQETAQLESAPETNNDIKNQKNNNKAVNIDKVQISMPIDDALERVTKKPFGIGISPSNSPVSPERFSGYHTGVDFEITDQEKDMDIAIMAICDGEIIYKDWVSGYGGAVIESCVLDEQEVTIIYGHVKLSSISENIGSKLIAGKQFSVLGDGVSQETDGERKHLHLGIHKGATLNLLGYVKEKEDLVNWVDVTEYFK